MEKKMENEMEAGIMGFIGGILGLSSGNIGIMEKKMEIIIMGVRVYFRWTPHPVIVTIRDTRDYIGVLLYSYYTTITGWGGSS